MKALHIILAPLRDPESDFHPHLGPFESRADAQAYADQEGLKDPVIVPLTTPTTEELAERADKAVRDFPNNRILAVKAFRQLSTETTGDPGLSASLWHVDGAYRRLRRDDPASQERLAKLALHVASGHFHDDSGAASELKRQSRGTSPSLGRLAHDDAVALIKTANEQIDQERRERATA